MKIKQTSKPNKSWEEMNDFEKLISVRFFKKESLHEENYLIRLEAYRIFGFTKKAMNDRVYEIRLEAYRSLGFTKKALKDRDDEIRLEAYRFLGFTKEAMNDEYYCIRFGAKTAKNLGLF